MLVAYVDPIGGAAGDMLLGALLNAGAPEEALRQRLLSLGIPGLKLLYEKEIRGFLHAARVEVSATETQPHRHLSDIINMVEAADLGTAVTAQAKATFQALAEAEGAVHGMDPAQVHFHEVGAVDSIIDVVGVLTALDLLGVERLESGPLPVCGGTIQSEHGTLPLPAPATVAIAAAHHVPLVGREGKGELVTPTAAALLATQVQRWGPYPAMKLKAVGYGAGRRRAAEGKPPNVTRVVLGEREAEAETPAAVVVLEANIDDQSPEQTAFVAERLRDAGALDVFLTPTHMKKGRAGVVLSTIASPERAGLLEDLLLVHSSTLGVRRREEARTVLPREQREVQTDYGTVRVKVAVRPDGRRSAAPEYEDCAARAREHGAPLIEVYQAALRAWETA